MEIEKAFETEIENLKNQILQDYEDLLILQPSLPPFNLLTAEMTTKQRAAFAYWLNKEHNQFIYIQLTDRKGRCHHARYLRGNEDLDEVYVSKIESSTGRLNAAESSQIRTWIGEHQQFNGLVAKNIQFSVWVKTQTIQCKRLWGKWFAGWAATVIASTLLFQPLGWFVLILGLLCSALKYQHYLKLKNKLKKQIGKKVFNINLHNIFSTANKKKLKIIIN